MRTTKLKRAILVPLACSIVIMWVAFAWHVYSNHNEQILERGRRRFDSTRELLKRKIASDAELMNTAIEVLMQDEHLQEAWLAKDRRKLLELCAPLLKELRTRHRITHFYFHDRDRLVNPSAKVAPPLLAAAATGISRQSREDPPPVVEAALASGQPVALFFTHIFCSACEKVKKEVLPDPRVRNARKGWRWISAEMQNEAGRELADFYHVDVSPTLLVLDARGRERKRLEGIYTVEQFETALKR